MRDWKGGGDPGSQDSIVAHLILMITLGVKLTITILQMRTFNLRKIK